MKRILNWLRRLLASDPAQFVHTYRGRIVECWECGALVYSATAQKKVGQGSRSSRDYDIYFCKAHRVSWDKVWYGKGWVGYYKNEVEVDKEGNPVHASGNSGAKRGNRGQHTRRKR